MYLFVTLNKANEQYKEYKLKGISGFSFTLEHYFSFYLSILFDLIFFFFLQQVNHDGKKKNVRNQITIYLDLHFSLWMKK